MPDEQTPSTGKTDSKKKTITELAEFHLKNQNHITTDEEIRNAEVEVTGITPDLEGNLAEVHNTTVITPSADEPTATEEKEEKKDKSIPNPYDVLR